MFWQFRNKCHRKYKSIHHETSALFTHALRKYNSDLFQQFMWLKLSAVASLSPEFFLSPDWVTPNLMSNKLEISMSDSSLNEYEIFEQDFDNESLVSSLRISSACERSRVDFDIFSSAVGNVCLLIPKSADDDCDRHKLLRRANRP